MSQFVLPPPSQEEPGDTLPFVDADPANASEFEPPYTDVYAATGRAPVPPFWRMVKWPLRKMLKSAYLLGGAAARHRITTLVTVALLLVFGGGGVAVYQATHPVVGPGVGQTAQGVISGASDTPFTIESASQPPLAPAVIHWLHAYKAGDAHELWNNLDPQFRGTLAQNGTTESDVQSQLAQYKATGVSFEQFIYTGGYVAPDGSSNYTVQVVIAMGGQRALRTWYFFVDSNDQIALFHDLTPQMQQ